MKIDAFGGGQTVGGITRTAREVERTGFDGLWIPEGRAPVFSLAAVAAAAVSDLALGSGVAVAFARSPMVTAQAAWMLADATGGNFRLGLGTQVRAHVERRYSADFAPPGPRMREYVRALREISANPRLLHVHPIAAGMDAGADSLRRPAGVPGRRPAVDVPHDR